MKPMRSARKRNSRPLWLPAADYYFLCAALAIGLFFLVWAILTDANEPSPWLPAGLAASALGIGAVVLREIILRRKRRQIAEAARLLDQSILTVKAHKSSSPAGLTLEQNAALLAEIKRKSDAAKVLARISASHREVFELCEAYLKAAEAELPRIRPGSPRVSAIRRGTDYAARLHHYHMLKWAELEAREITQNASVLDTPAAKLSETKKALQVIQIALDSYPVDAALLESQRVVQDAVTALEVRSLIRRAERAEERNRTDIALKNYRRALRLVGDSNLSGEEKSEIAMELEHRIRQLNNLS